MKIIEHILYVTTRVKYYKNRENKYKNVGIKIWHWQQQRI